MRENREIRLLARSRGLPTASQFAVVATPMPELAPGEVLVRNLFFRVSASLRMMIGEGAEAVKGVPFPALAVGDTIGGEALGEVLSAPADSGLAAGDLVLHPFGWRDYATPSPAQCQRVPDILPQRAAHLSHGFTAYAALTRGLKLHPGDTVFISSAAGAIGSMAGQIARRLGAGRIVGSTGSSEKAARLVDDLGYSAAIVRGSRPFADQLRAAAPEGIDVCIDTVGGEQLEAAIALARENARLLLLGTLSGQLAAEGAGRTTPLQLDAFQLLIRKLTLRGYSADDDPDLVAEWDRRFAQWLDAGHVVFPHVVVDGIANAPQALEEVARGRYFGTVLVAP